MKLYSTSQAIAYLERHPDAVFEAPPVNFMPSYRLAVIGDSRKLFCLKELSAFGEWLFRDSSIPHRYNWHLVSPRPKRERVRVGMVTIEGDNDIEVSDVDLRKLPNGTWTVYAVKAER